MPPHLTIIIPAKNETSNLLSLLPRIQEHCPNAEILVANDGSTDYFCIHRSEAS